MKTKLISISGKLKNGKDTFADYIKAELSHYIMLESYDKYHNRIGKLVVKMSFADPIKEAVWKMFPDLTKEDLWGPSQNRSKIIENCINPLTGEPLIIRDCLTSIGALGRKWNEAFWASAAVNKANQLIKKDTVVIISDCRYKNEKEAVEKAGGVVIRVIRPDLISDSIDPSEIDLDETPLSEYDYVVNNTGLEDLRQQAKDIAAKLYNQ